MFYLVGIFRASGLEGSITSNPEINYCNELSREG